MDINGPSCMICLCHSAPSYFLPFTSSWYWKPSPWEMNFSFHLNPFLHLTIWCSVHIPSPSLHEMESSELLKFSESWKMWPGGLCPEKGNALVFRQLIKHTCLWGTIALSFCPLLLNASICLWRALFSLPIHIYGKVKCRSLSWYPSMHEVFQSTCSSLFVRVGWMCSRQWRSAVSMCSMGRGRRPSTLVVVQGENCNVRWAGHLDMPGSTPAQTVQLQCQWLCGTVVVRNSMNNLSFDVKVYARKRNRMFLSCTV